MNYVLNELKGITPYSIEKYMLIKGWARDTAFRNKNYMVFINDNYPINRLAVLANENYEDFYYKLYDVFLSMSKIENISVDQIINDIKYIYLDRLEFRVISSHTSEGKIPLLYASEFVEGLKELILSSTCAELSPKPFYHKYSQKAKEALNKFDLAQTDIGSYIFNIDISILDDELEQTTINNDLVSMPMAHKVVRRINTAIHQINQVVEKQNKASDLADTGYETGITANMCDALLKLRGDGFNEVESTIRYAGAINNQFGQFDRIQLTDNHFYILEEVSKIIKDKKLFEDVLLRGVVKSLSKHEISADECDKVITLCALYNGVNKNIRIALSENDYRLACDAHRDNLEVEVSGELDMSSKHWELNDIKSFTIG